MAQGQLDEPYSEMNQESALAKAMMLGHLTGVIQIKYIEITGWRKQINFLSYSWCRVTKTEFLRTNHNVDNSVIEFIIL